MNLVGHIRELLFNKDFVIVPEFGGFVCKTFASTINEATQMFVPPTRKVTFQEALQNHDISLISYVAQREGCSLNEAESFIKSVVADWKATLNEGKHIILEEVGRIYKDVNGKLAFQADINANFSSDSFGLAIFRFPVLKQEPTLQSQVNKVFPHAVRKQNGKFGYWKAAAVFVGVFGLFAIGVQKSDFKAFDTASFNPWALSKSKIVEPVSVDEDQNSSYEIEATVAPIEAKTIVTEENIPTLEESLHVEIEISKPFHVIVGAFKEQANANKLVASLSKQGYGASFIFFENGLYRVSIDQYITREAADIDLAQYKAKVQKGAWVYRK